MSGSCNSNCWFYPHVWVLRLNINAPNLDQRKSAVVVLKFYVSCISIVAFVSYSKPSVIFASHVIISLVGSQVVGNREVPLVPIVREYVLNCEVVNVM